MGQLKTFRERYCERHRITHGKFELALVWRCLHWQARPFFWLLWVNRDYFAADFDFVRGVGELRSRREFRNEVAEYYGHPRNRGLLRRLCRLRVSSRRLQEEFEREIGQSGTAGPS